MVPGIYARQLVPWLHTLDSIMPRCGKSGYRSRFSEEPERHGAGGLAGEGGPGGEEGKVEHRQRQKIHLGRPTSNGTINRELAVLRRMPRIRMPKEDGPQQGFFVREQYESVRRHLPPNLQAAAAAAPSGTS